MASTSLTKRSIVIPNAANLQPAISGLLQQLASYSPIVLHAHLSPGENVQPYTRIEMFLSSGNDTTVEGIISPLQSTIGLLTWAETVAYGL